MWWIRYWSLALALILCGQPLTAQVMDAWRPRVAPSSATMQVGETKIFSAYDDRGAFLADVRWSALPADIVQLSPGSPIHVKALRTGYVTLTAYANGSFAEATIEVVAHRPVACNPTWIPAELKGCKQIPVTSVEPIEKPDGATLIRLYQCSDSKYERAYDCDGNLVWQGKISGNPTKRAAAKPKALITNARMNPHARSVCDSISIGMNEAAVRELLSPPVETSAPVQKILTVEEDGSECKLWFDDLRNVAEKQKTLTTQ